VHLVESNAVGAERERRDRLLGHERENVRERTARALEVRHPVPERSKTGPGAPSLLVSRSVASIAGVHSALCTSSARTVSARRERSSAITIAVSRAACGTAALVAQTVSSGLITGFTPVVRSERESTPATVRAFLRGLAFDGRAG